MRVISAYLLAVLGGKSAPSASDVTTILHAVGLEADHDEVSKLISDLEGKDINEVISEGLGRLSSVPSGGAVAAAGGAAAGAAAGGDAPAEEAKVEEEEEDEDMGFSLFD